MLGDSPCFLPIIKVPIMQPEPLTPGSVLPREFYTRTDTLAVARDLLGKILATRWDGELTTGIIVETEAYLGREDRASHAYGGRHTERTRTMYARGGTAYVYLCYGIHDMFNVVTGVEGIPHAILVRAVQPLAGVDIMLRRRGMQQLHPRITAGPGALAKAMGIQVKHTGMDLLGHDMWLEDRGIHFQADEIIASNRVGVGYAGEDALLPYRFRVKDSAWTSKAK
jgi:DNA-3-methyladenine glycosylase